jgi:hypothetical protein
MKNRYFRRNVEFIVIGLIFLFMLLGLYFLSKDYCAPSLISVSISLVLEILECRFGRLANKD